MFRSHGKLVLELFPCPVPQSHNPICLSFHQWKSVIKAVHRLASPQTEQRISPYNENDAGAGELCHRREKVWIDDEGYILDGQAQFYYTPGKPFRGSFLSLSLNLVEA
jgi:hypothetical protein